MPFSVCREKWKKNLARVRRNLEMFFLRRRELQPKLSQPNPRLQLCQNPRQRSFPLFCNIDPDSSQGSVLSYHICFLSITSRTRRDGGETRRFPTMENKQREGSLMHRCGGGRSAGEGVEGVERSRTAGALAGISSGVSARGQGGGRTIAFGTGGDSRGGGSEAGIAAFSGAVDGGAGIASRFSGGNGYG